MREIPRITQAVNDVTAIEQNIDHGFGWVAPPNG